MLTNLDLVTQNTILHAYAMGYKVQKAIQTYDTIKQQYKPGIEILLLSLFSFRQQNLFLSFNGTPEVQGNIAGYRDSIR